MRWRASLPKMMFLAVMCAFITGCGGTLSSEQAACAAPASDLEASPEQAAPTEPFSLRGEGFFGEYVCNDTAPPESQEPSGPRPDESIKIEFVQGDREWNLATVSSDENLSFKEEFEVPADAEPGQATVRATSSSQDIYPDPQEASFTVLGALPDTGGKAGLEDP